MLIASNFSFYWDPWLNAKLQLKVCLLRSFQMLLLTLLFKMASGLFLNTFLYLLKPTSMILKSLKIEKFFGKVFKNRLIEIFMIIIFFKKARLYGINIFGIKIVLSNYLPLHGQEACKDLKLLICWLREALMFLPFVTYAIRRSKNHKHLFFDFKSQERSRVFGRGGSPCENQGFSHRGGFLPLPSGSDGWKY